MDKMKELKAAKAAEAAEAAEVKRLRVALAKAYLCLSLRGKECLDGTIVYLDLQARWKLASVSDLVDIGRDIQWAANYILPHCESME